MSAALEVDADLQIEGPGGENIRLMGGDPCLVLRVPKLAVLVRYSALRGQWRERQARFRAFLRVLETTGLVIEIHVREVPIAWLGSPTGSGLLSRWLGLPGLRLALPGLVRVLLGR